MEIHKASEGLPLNVHSCYRQHIIGQSTSCGPADTQSFATTNTVPAAPRELLQPT